MATKKKAEIVENMQENDELAIAVEQETIVAPQPVVKTVVLTKERVPVNPVSNDERPAVFRLMPLHQLALALVNIAGSDREVENEYNQVCRDILKTGKFDWLIDELIDQKLVTEDGKITPFGVKWTMQNSHLKPNFRKLANASESPSTAIAMVVEGTKALQEKYWLKEDGSIQPLEKGKTNLQDAMKDVSNFFYDVIDAANGWGKAEN